MMELFAEREGKYVFRTTKPAWLRVALVAPVIGLTLTFLVLGFLMNRSEGSGLTGMRHVLLPSLVASVAVMALVITLIYRKLYGSRSIVVDLQERKLGFADPLTQQLSKRISIPLEDIREMAMAHRPAGVPGRVPGPVWIVRINTTGGEYDLFVSRDRAKAEQFANELSSLSSIRLRESAV